MQLISTAVTAAANRLRSSSVEDPGGDAGRLMAHALAQCGGGVPKYSDSLGLRELAQFEDYVSQRAARRPISQIIGKRHFYCHEFIVNSDVLDPRPETETLVEAALGFGCRRIMDMGTGSGCVLLSLLAEGSEVSGLGVDRSNHALAVARRNAALLGLAHRASFVHSDWFSAVSGKFELIVSNPPYVSLDEYETLAPEIKDWEPREALTLGGDGLRAYRAIAEGAGRHLQHGGRILLEVGPGQVEPVSSIFRDHGFCLEDIRCDLDGRQRVVAFRQIED